MKAIRIHDYGDASAPTYEDAPVPEPPNTGRSADIVVAAPAGADVVVVIVASQ